MDDFSGLLQRYLNLIYIAFVLLVGLTLAVRFVAEDARNRGMSPIVVPLMVFLTFPFGIVVWMLLRPQVMGTINDRHAAPAPAKTAGAQAEGSLVANWLSIARAIRPRRPRRYYRRRQTSSQTKLASWNAPARTEGD